MIPRRLDYIRHFIRRHQRLAREARLALPRISTVSIDVRSQINRRFAALTRRLSLPDDFVSGTEMAAGVGHNSRQQVVVYPRMIEVGVWRQSLVDARNSGWFTKPAGGWLGGSGGSPDRSVKCSRAPPLNLSTEPNDRQPPGVLIPGFGAAPPSTIQLGTTRLQLQLKA
jgi:hypothetical protein